MKNILVPTDFSENAYNALLFATQLFKGEVCTFYLLNTFEVKTPMLTSRINTSKGQELYTRLKKESTHGLAQVKRAIAKDSESPEHVFKTASISKDLVTTISKTISSKNIDLLVMGTKGATGAKKLFMGSNTVKVIQKERQCPILAVPMETAPYKSLKIGFPTDLNHRLSTNELAPLLRIIAMVDSYVHIIHVVKNGELNNQQLQNLNHLKTNLSEDQIIVHGLQDSGSITNTINNFVEKENINLLIMVNTKNSLMQQLAKEPIIKKLGYKSNVPLLTIPEGV